ncbi:16S rRNA (guanine(527)-N(7))-methyltransferase RsmG [Rhabdochromatium marinum]|uniref:16S rRNA (guanine(527)-N(7))-methyltransferase RsmG n=1 Tax=Rhabdochromatium marinum TaxID=48729 RepID=UPI0019047239|nr:16S rRNA (guanine(527)-N(7))-methyltransferase RsmG [Rhabdochromatium marinum]MBK1649759.1 16S rRNA (guanine(527)-N(7))-methyltransferase RsmG [Rhabdochromatium marinum]
MSWSDQPPPPATKPILPRAALRERLDQGCAQLGGRAASLSETQRDTLLDYLEQLAHWNQRFNLTAVRDPLEMVGRHLLDSLAAADVFSATPILDLGTGAGLPGIPLAIACPEHRFVLLDSVGKKTRFVRQAAATLGLGNVTVVQARLESYQPREKFATITARALAPLSALWVSSAELRRPEAPVIAYKGRLADDELAELAATGARWSVTRLEVPFVPGERHLIRIDSSSGIHG